MFIVLSIVHNIGSNDFWEYWTASFSNILRHAPKLFTSSHSEGGRGEENNICLYIYFLFSYIYISIKLYNLSSCIELISSCTFYTLYLSLNWYGDIARYTLCFCISCWHDLHKRAAMCPTETYSKYFFPPQKLKKDSLSKIWWMLHIGWLGALCASPWHWQPFTSW